MFTTPWPLCINTPLVSVLVITRPDHWKKTDCRSTRDVITWSSSCWSCWHSWRCAWPSCCWREPPLEALTTRLRRIQRDTEVSTIFSIPDFLKSSSNLIIIIGILYANECSTRNLLHSSDDPGRSCLVCNNRFVHALSKAAVPLDASDQEKYSLAKHENI